MTNFPVVNTSPLIFLTKAGDQFIVLDNNPESLIIIAVRDSDFG